MTPNRISDSYHPKSNARITILSVCIALLFVVMISTALFMEDRINKNVNQAVKDNAVQSIETGKSVLVSTIRQYQKNIKLLENSPALINYVKVLINTNEASLSSATSREIETPQEKSVKQLFSSLVQQNKEIEQLRVIAYPTGVELIRMQRENGQLNDVTQSMLQNKSERDYFAQAASIKDDEIYVSSINLNKENGEIQYPIAPTLRLAIPLYDGENDSIATQTVAVLVANINAQYLLDALLAGVDSRFSAYLLNDKLGFLTHPDTSKAFAHEFDEEYTWQSVYGNLTTLENALIKTSTQKTLDPTFIYIKRDIVLSNRSNKAGEDESLIVTLIIAVPESLIESMLNERRLNTFGITGLFSVLVLILLLFFNSYVKNNTMLNRAKSEYKAIVDGSADAIIGVALTGVIITWNKASESLFGIPSSNALNKFFDELITLPKVKISGQIEKFKANPFKTNTRFESSFTNFEGEQSLELSVSAITTFADGIIGVSIICKNITLQKHAQAQIQNINQSLENQVNERTRELELAKNEAEHANVIKSTFISNVSHEMRTPLNGILGTLELVTKEPLSDTQKSYLHMTETCIGSLTMLINDILDLSKIGAGKMSLEKGSFDLINEFEETIIPLSIKAYSKNLTFIFDASNVKFRHLVGDKKRINQITNNILSNAVKFTENGEISVHLQSYQAQTGIVILCAISDTGIGIDEQYYDKLFGSFNQEDTSVSNKLGGTGLGLSICKQLSKLMDGDVSFKSEKGTGSTFYFILTVDQDDAKENKTPLLQNVKVSLACEHKKESTSIKTTLESMGATVVEINNTAQLGDESSILLIDDEFTQKPALMEMFNSQPKTYTCIIEMLTPLAFSSGSQNKHQSKNLQLMKPFTTNGLIDLLSNTDDFINLVNNSGILTNQCKYKLPQAPLGILANRVLIVDDNDINVEVLKGMIADHVNITFTASNGKDALTIMSRSANSGALFDLILLDCNMPIMDGLECVKRIRQGEAGEIYAHVPVIAITADAMLGDLEKCLSAGMTDYLTKPVKSNLLIETIAKWTI
jgi:PAS domain S-box-containing protein